MIDILDKLKNAPQIGNTYRRNNNHTLTYEIIGFKENKVFIRDNEGDELVESQWWLNRYLLNTNYYTRIK